MRRSCSMLCGLCLLAVMLGACTDDASPPVDVDGSSIGQDGGVDARNESQVDVTVANDHAVDARDENRTDATFIDAGGDRRDSNSLEDVTRDESTADGDTGHDSADDGGDADGSVDGRMCRDTSSCPLYGGLPTKFVVTCDSPLECPLCIPLPAFEPCSTEGLTCDYTGANLAGTCTCRDLRKDPQVPADAAPPGDAPYLAYRCLI